MKEVVYKNKYIDKFMANIVSIESITDFGEINGELSKILIEENLFFPGGGGQLADEGKVDDKKIIAFEKGKGDVNYIITQEIKKNIGDEVVCKIDWNSRFDAMQQHLGEHILAGTAYKHFGINTRSFHMGKEVSQLDLTEELTEDQIYNIERLANMYINSRMEVKNYIINSSDLTEVKVRREVETDEDLRVLKVGDIDTTLCCGMHPDNTIEVQEILILKHYKNNNATRLEFVAGDRAVRISIRNKDILKRLSNQFSCSEEKLEKAVNKLNEKYEKDREEIKSYRNDIIDLLYSEESLKNMIKLDVVAFDFTKYDNDFSKNALKKYSHILTDNVLVGVSNDMVASIFNNSLDESSLDNFINYLKETLGFKGGGSGNFIGGRFPRDLDFEIIKDKLQRYTY